MAWWLGIFIGIGVMGGYVALRVLTHHLARARSDVRSSLLVELGGLGARMVIVLCAVALVLALAPVSPVSFVGTVLSLLVVSIITETVFVVRRLR